MLKSEPQVEVAVWKDDAPYLRKTLRRFPASIGRGAGADIRLDSPHVSRVHAHLHCEGDVIRLVDAGSTNGFSLHGERMREARLAAGDRVDLCGFVLRVRRIEEEPLASELSQGWAELLKAEDENTGVRRRSELPATDRTIALEDAPDLSPQEDEEEDARPPDLPSLLTTLHEEANALLYGDSVGEVAVEVIQAVGERVYNVALLRAGHTCWWGGRPQGLARLAPQVQSDRFPMVTHLGAGIYRVQAPNDPLWKIFHRGEGDLELHRSGFLVGAQVEPADQIEITFGPFTSYVRCVRIPEPTPLRGARLRVDAWLFLALIFSLGVHAASVWLPWRPFAPLKARAVAAADRFVTSIPVTYVPPPAPLPPASPPLHSVQALAHEPRPPIGVQGRKLRSKSPQPPAAPTPEPREEPAAAPPAAPALSIADFKVTGFVAGLPSLGLDSDARPTLRGGPTLLRGDALPVGVTLKGEGSVRPHGRLSDLAVSRVVNAHAAQIERCYTRSLEDVPDLAGRIEAEWIVDKAGLVRNVRVTFDDMGSPALTRCVRAAIASWVFPPPVGGPASVAYPFVFNNLRR